MHERRISAALLASCAVHAGMIAITLLAMRVALTRSTFAPTLVDERHVSLIWQAGRSGGGGSGGDNTPLPPRRVARQGTDARTVPAGPTPTIDPSRQLLPEM